MPATKTVTVTGGSPWPIYGPLTINAEVPETWPAGQNMAIHWTPAEPGQNLHYSLYDGNGNWVSLDYNTGLSGEGDIVIDGADAAVFCLPGILGHLLTVERIGRVSVRAEEIAPEDVRPPKRETKESRFTVMSLRLDAVASGMFRLSRTACAKLIDEGLLSLNYSVCTKADAPVREGDVLSLRGHGKGVVAELGGSSRKGRVFVTAEVYV